MRLLEDLVGCNREREIMVAMPGRREGRDLLIWHPSRDGQFSSSSA